MKTSRHKKRHTYLVFVPFLAAACLTLGLFLTQTPSSAEESRTAHYTSIQVQAGDSLWSIAEQYSPEKDTASIKAYAKRLAEFNCLRNADYIRAGSYLCVIYYE